VAKEFATGETDTKKQATTWGQIKELMDMMTMVTSNMGMARNPTATLLVALVIITIQMGASQRDAHWTIMPKLPMVHPITWQNHRVAIFTDDTVPMGGHSSGHLVTQYSD
jgi:predicted RND superfamily exporter protein